MNEPSPTPIPVPLVVTSLEQTCFACPSQWEGATEDNRQIYVRYRWGHLSVSVSEPYDDSQYAAVQGARVYDGNLGDGFDGCIDLEEVVAATKGVVDWSAVL